MALTVNLSCIYCLLSYLRYLAIEGTGCRWKAIKLITRGSQLWVLLKVWTETAERHHRHSNLLLKAIHCKLNWHVAQQHVQASQAENKSEAIDDSETAVTFKFVLECWKVVFFSYGLVLNSLWPSSSSTGYHSVHIFTPNWMCYQLRILNKGLSKPNIAWKRHKSNWIILKIVEVKIIINQSISNPNAQSSSLVSDWKPAACPLHMCFIPHVESEGCEPTHQYDSFNPPLGQVPWQQKRWL